MGAGKIKHGHREQRPELLPGEARSARPGAAILGAASNDKREGKRMNELNAAFAWVNKLATVQKPEEVSTREAETEEASA